MASRSRSSRWTSTISNKTITASYGCSLLSESSTLTDLLAVAGALLYVAKRKGRNRVEPAAA